jgi:hypothetical protein
MRILSVCFLFSLFASCESSPLALGPDISKGERPTALSGAVASGQGTAQQPTTQQSATDSSTEAADSSTEAADSSTVTASIACARQTGHNVYYAATSISLTYLCDQTVTEVLPVDMPSFLSASISGATVSFAGTTGSAGLAVTWHFTVNSTATTGNASSISTQVIDSAALIATLNGSPSTPPLYNMDISIGLDLSLAASWDGTMGTSSIVPLALTTDLHGLTLAASCAAPTTSYVCVDTQTATGNALSRSLNLKWQWSAFDQGVYSLASSATLTVDGSTVAIGTTTPLSITIPIQSAGNKTIDPLTITGLSDYDSDSLYSYALAIGDTSTDKNPVLGLLFVGGDGADSSHLKRISIDRTDDASGGATGVTESTNIRRLSNGTNSSFYSLQASGSGRWTIIGVQAGANNNLYLSTLADPAPLATSLPAIGVDYPVNITGYTALGVNANGKIVATTPVFDDAGTPRLGLAFVQLAAGPLYNLTIAKINPAGTGTVASAYTDDPRYLASGGGLNVISGGAEQIDRVHIAWISENSVDYFYVAYRQNLNLKVAKLRSVWSASLGYDATTPGILSTGVFANSGTANTQDLRMALGVKAAATVVGVVYKRTSGNQNCYFRRFNGTLTVPSTELALTTTTCHRPSIHYNANSGRFVVTMAVVNSGTTFYEIVTTEISLNSDQTGLDTFSAPVTVTATGGTAVPSKLETAFYPAGHWMGVFYKITGLDEIRIHGYHVPSR